MNSSVTQDKKKSKAKEENPDGNMFVEDSSEIEKSNSKGSESEGGESEITLTLDSMDIDQMVQEIFDMI